MTLKSGIEIPVELVSEMCGRYDIAEFAVSGSAAGGDMGAESDIDVMVEFSLEARVGILRFAELNEELERRRRRVDSGDEEWTDAVGSGNAVREARGVFHS